MRMYSPVNTSPSAFHLKGWGDALARQGQSKAALAKYDEALQFAPAWKELRAAREAVAK
jgi:predicted negative regulator of RcsB-dependent stress response